MENHKFQVDVQGTISLYRHSTMSVLTAINEFVDNSLDAGAKEIRITETGGDLIIKDNGEGFSNFGDAVFLGKSPKVNKGQIGRHGVGMKAACIKFSSATSVRSQGKEMIVPWDNIMDGMIEPQFNVTKCDIIEGTEIILHDFDKLRSTQALQPQLLAKTYAMLIHYKAAEIKVNGEPLTMPPFPNYDKALDTVVQWRGREARIIGGTYKTDDPNRRNWSGYYAYYNGRLIKGGILECGRGDLICSNFAYHLYLKDGTKDWKLSTHKDDVRELEEFIEYVFDTVTETDLEIAAKDAEIIELKEIEDAVNEALGNKRNGKRDNSNSKKEGTVRPQETQRKRIHTNYHDAEGGYVPDKVAPKKSKGVQFAFEKMDGCTLGSCERIKGSRRSWKFNLNNSFIDAFKTDKKCIAPLVLFFNELCNTVGESELFAEDTLMAVMEKTGYHLDGTEESFK